MTKGGPEEPPRTLHFPAAYSTSASCRFQRRRAQPFFSFFSSFAAHADMTANAAMTQAG